MKRALLLLLLAPLACFAESVSLNFTGVPVVQFAQLTYKEMLGKDYFVSPQLVAEEARVSIYVRSIDKAKLPQLLDQVLRSAGVEARETDGLVVLSKVAAPVALPGLPASSSFAPNPNMGLPPEKVEAPKEPPAPEDYEVYRPRYRTADYLRSVVGFAGAGGPSGGAGRGVPAQGQQQGQGPGPAAVDVVVFSGTEEKRDKLRKLLAELDQKPEALNVRAALVEYVATTDNALSFSGILDLFSKHLRISLSPREDGQSPQYHARLKSGTIDLVLGALAEDGRFKFRTTPYIRLVDGERGRLQVGSDVPVRGDTQVAANGSTVTSTQYRSSGVVLTVLPRVMRDRIQAYLTQEVSNFAKTTTSSIDSPTLNKRLIETTIDAEDGEVVVLAGLDELLEADGKSGPFSFLPLNKIASTRSVQLLVLLEFRRV